MIYGKSEREAELHRLNKIETLKRKCFIFALFPIKLTDGPNAGRKAWLQWVEMWMTEEGNLKSGYYQRFHYSEIEL
jgi:hypothetical protein